MIHGVGIPIRDKYDLLKLTECSPLPTGMQILLNTSEPIGQLRIRVG